MRISRTGHVKRPHLSQRSWFLDIHVHCQDVRLWEDLAKTQKFAWTLSWEGEEIQRSPIFWVSVNTNHIHPFGAGNAQRNSQKTALVYLDSKEKKTCSSVRSATTEAVFQGNKKPKAINMNIFGTLCKEVPIKYCKCRLSFHIPKEMQVWESNTRSGLWPLLLAGQKVVCVTEHFVLLHLCSPDRLRYWCT